MANIEFSDFPIEVIYHIFSFLDDEEILKTFGNVNSYFKALVIHYIKVIRIDLIPVENGNEGFQIVGLDRKSLDILFEIPDLIFELVIGSATYVEEKKRQFAKRKFCFYKENLKSVDWPNRMKLMICCKRSTDYCYHDIINHHLGIYYFLFMFYILLFIYYCSHDNINHHIGRTRKFCDVESLQMEIFQIAWKYPSEQCSHMWNGTCSIQLKSIPQFTNLRKLHFRGDFNVDSGVDDFFIRNLHLKLLLDLSLEFCHETTDAGLSHISKESHQLKRFALISNNNVTDLGLAHIAHGCKQLENLKISMCNNITDNGIEQVGIGCKKLKIIYLRDVHVTEESLMQVLNEFEKIEKLTLDGYSNISETVIPHAITNCKNLQELKLPNCTHISNDRFERFNTHYSYLKGGGEY